MAPACPTCLPAFLPDQPPGLDAALALWVGSLFPRRQLPQLLETGNSFSTLRAIRRLLSIDSLLYVHFVSCSDRTLLF